MNKNRLEAFTDAIIAIAATIMVLELHIPQYNTLASLVEEWPVFLAYFISFTLIYTVWYNHHNLFKKAKIISKQTYLFNGIWVFLLALVPFTSNWVGRSPNDTLPGVLFIVVLLLWSVMFQVLDWQVLKDNPEAKRDVTVNFTYRSILYGGYVIALVLAFTAPIYSLIVIGIISVAMMVVMFFD
ncbi:TMEM175 family protein [Granulicatella seriolae]|jgi:uncharacterized membrane protein|uniref:TMEM175 family protein n=1 Tax=Granulicatella seriolae TaxID=2967226 RepID=A0ABT1WPA6_9LACT|nr:TMEM175 family protein [Granulicatella seriolae]